MSAIAAGQPAVNPEDSGPYDADEPAASAADRIAALRARLITPLPGDGIWGWVWPLLVTVFAGILRFDRLSSPDAVVFGEFGDARRRAVRADKSLNMTARRAGTAPMRSARCTGRPPWLPRSLLNFPDRSHAEASSV